eukprot:gene17446-5562_t
MSEQHNKDEEHRCDEDRGAGSSAQPCAKRRRGPCYHPNSTGEKVHVLMFKTDEERKEAFERTAQEIAAEFYSLEQGVTDVRVAHRGASPRARVRGALDVAFILTFVSDRELQRFVDGPQRAAEAALRPHV